MSDTSFRTRRRQFESPNAAPPSASSGDAAALPSAAAPPSVADSADGGVSSPWRPIDDEARSGKTVVVRSLDGEETEAKWVTSRRYVAAKLKWESYQHWITVCGRLKFVPAQWRPLR